MSTTMLNRSFCHFDGLSESAEVMLWKNGVHDWCMFEKRGHQFLSQSKYESVVAQIRFARVALSSGLAAWFLDRLKSATKMRVWQAFLEDATYLDVETTGLGPKDVITSIVTLRHGKVACFVRGINLEAFLAQVRGMSLLVTFNGAAFDIPVIRRDLGVSIQAGHLDLMHVGRSLGWRGGLKQIEATLNLPWCTSGRGDGSDAVKWWRDHQLGDHTALPKLLKYNSDDTLVLEHLARALFKDSTSHLPSPIAVPRIPNRSLTIEQTQGIVSNLSQDQ